MKTRKRSSMSKPADQQAQQLCDAIHSLGDYEHIRVRAERGHLNIYPDEYEPVAGDISHLAQDLVNTLAPYLQNCDFTDRKSGSGH